MALTKTQINYLKEKVYRIVNKKIADYSKELKANQSVEEIVQERLKNKEIKVISQKQLCELILKDNSYYRSFGLSSLIVAEDYNKVLEEKDRRNKLLNEYTKKLYEIQENALDEFVLKGVDIETILTKLEEA